MARFVIADITDARTFLKSSAALLSQSYHLYPFSLLSWRACPLYGGLDVKRKIVPQATRPSLAFF
jgi:hypothetical protein